VSPTFLKEREKQKKIGEMAKESNAEQIKLIKSRKFEKIVVHSL
jgi:hypothetical protein